MQLLKDKSISHQGTQQDHLKENHVEINQHRGRRVNSRCQDLGSVCPSPLTHGIFRMKRFNY